MFHMLCPFYTAKILFLIVHVESLAGSVPTRISTQMAQRLLRKDRKGFFRGLRVLCVNHLRVLCVYKSLAGSVPQRFSTAKLPMFMLQY